MRLLLTTAAAVLIILLALPALAQDARWVARFDGAGATNDIALAMDIDATGNVYVAGYSYGANGDDDVRLVKFSPDGDFLWTAEFSGGVGWDDARDLAVGPDGAVTLVGFTATKKDWDLLVIQYAPDGTRNWLTTWSGPGMDDGKTIAVDAAGYVYVAAESDGPDLSDDIVTLRFTPDGELDWAQRYAGAGGWNDAATDIAVTPAGVATVTGSGRDTSFDLLTLQYDPDGQLRWVDTYDPLGYSWELGTAVALDAAGRAYVTGIELTAAGTDDMVVICYEPTGDRAWVRTFDGDPNTYDNAKSIAVGGDGIVAITGCSTVQTRNPDIRTIAYDTDGNHLWTDRYTGPRIRGDDCGEVVMVADDGSVAVAGTSPGLTTDDDFVALFFSPTGDRLWEARYNGPGNGTDEVTGAALAPDGSLVVSGVSPDQTVDFAVIKYNTPLVDDDDDNDTTDDDDDDDDDTVDDDDDNNDAVDDDDTVVDDDDDDDDNDGGCGC
jgi:uncharacterized delta-60 repeat protein